MGRPASQGFSASTPALVRARLFAAFNETEAPKKQTSTALYDFRLWRILLSAAQDPDAEVLPRWLEHGCPTGIDESVIDPTGIFPPTEGPSSAIRAARACAESLAQQGWSEERHINYSSFYEKEGMHAEAEI